MHIHIETIKHPKPGRKVLILLTYQRRSSVCCIYMDPDLWVVLQHFGNLREVVNRACCRRAECHCQVEWFQSLRLQLFNFLPEERASERVVRCRGARGFDGPVLYASDQAPFLSGAMGLV